ncbi:phage shock protein PspC (stress-responsive transcriptional regulator) [Chryseobacterium sediminis]|uniref:Phage shock protein PspC (Stress-responsive transcriptional regulator) n=1 Tax=Chryseobacterium sediminis TaxID=1679494 RepID=A0ABR6PZV8_9FLAO|nr:PspC domain-containing protein [Chryseobacterium sediminis]MBB6331251.1 phage shock protein PspC (stress-responsive transcriptional regulator) [Chryseobacterium sediminis]
MNKTLSIGLAGFSFTIEEHAYIKLSDYLNALRSSLEASEADEVMHDIEIRMVEIFKDSLGKREVINDTDVEKVIAQIGSPEKIEEQEEAYFSEKTSTRKNYSGNNYTDKKQLFRDPEKQKVAGVCAGLAQYVGMDITTMRAIWLGIFVLGIFTAAISSSLIGLLYVILWIVLPKAETAADFLKMQGKPMNFDNLKNESNKLVQFANESTQRVGEIYNENKPYINNAGSGVWNIFKYIVGGFFVLMAVGSIIGVFVLFGLFGMDTDFPGANEIRFYMDDQGLDKVLAAMMVIGSLIPAILFSLLSIKIFSPKTKLRNIGWVVGGLFLLLIGLGTYFGISMAKKDMIYRGSKEDVENVAINTTSDTLYVDVKQINIPQNFKAYNNDIYSDKRSVYEEDYISVDVTRKADIKTPYLIIKKEGKGYNFPIQLTVPVEVVNNKILLPNYIKYPYEHRFRDYSLEYELVVPQKARVISMNQNHIHMDGDLDGDGINDEDQDSDEDNNNVRIEKNKITVNGSSIEYNSDDKDSIIVNGKKVPNNQAKKVIDSAVSNIKKSNKDMDIKIKDGKNEISIQTK